MPKLREALRLSPRSLARHVARVMASSTDTDVTQPAALRARAREQPEEYNCLRVLSVVQRLLARELRQQKLSKRRAAREGHIAIGTLVYFLDRSRIEDPNRRPKRRLRRSTVLQLRDIFWIRGLLAGVLDRLLEIVDRDAD